MRRAGAAQKDSGKIEIWAHDLSGEPGMIYRYRLRVRVMNPLFQQKQLVKKQENELGNLLALDSEATPWTQPIEIEPRLRFYVVRSNKRSQKATVEVYRLFDAKRQMGKYTITPGDPIGGTIEVEYNGEMVDVDMWTDAIALDMDTRTHEERGARSNNILIYYDHQRGQLAERIVEADSLDPDRIRLENEAAEALTEERSARAELR